MFVGNDISERRSTNWILSTQVRLKCCPTRIPRSSALISHVHLTFYFRFVSFVFQSQSKQTLELEPTRARPRALDPGNRSTTLTKRIEALGTRMRWWPAHFHVLLMKGWCAYSREASLLSRRARSAREWKRYICKQSPYWRMFSFFITFPSPKPSHLKIYICLADLYINTAVSFKSNITKIYYCWAPILDPIYSKRTSEFPISSQYWCLTSVTIARKINSFTRKRQFIKTVNFTISQGKLDSFKEVRGRWHISA